MAPAPPGPAPEPGPLHDEAAQLVDALAAKAAEAGRRALAYAADPAVRRQAVTALDAAAGIVEQSAAAVGTGLAALRRALEPDDQGKTADRHPPAAREGDGPASADGAGSGPDDGRGSSWD